VELTKKMDFIMSQILREIFVLIELVLLVCKIMVLFGGILSPNILFFINP